MNKTFYDEDGNECTLLKLEDLESKHEGNHDILLQTIVTGSSEIEHYPYFIVFHCPECKAEPQLGTPEDYDDWRDIPTGRKCFNCNIPMLIKQVNKGQLRKILMTEQGTKNPIHLTGFVYGKDIHNINPGTKLNLRGTLRSRKMKPKDLTYKRFFDISQYTKSDEKPIVPTDEEIEKFKEMDKTDLIRSFAPHIRNMYTIKEGLLLCCLGGVETDNIRGDINALLLGDPGTAKTQLLKFVTEIIPKSDYVSGKSASGAGLFGGVDNLADGTRIGKPGSVTMCNGGVAALDEMEKMNNNDRTYCHEVMESQMFSLRKIGIDITWEVKVAIIGAANPKKSIWNPELTINENVDLPASLLSRFGLIFLVRDIANKQEDIDIAKHILKGRKGEIESPLTPEDITKFINYAKTIKPCLNDEADETLLNWWAELREETQKEGSIAVDKRTMEDLIRLTEAYARLHLTEVATEQHANMAIQMLKDSLKTLGMNTPGEKNESIQKHMNKNDFVASVFKDPIGFEAAVVKMCENKYFPDDWSAKEHIAKLRSKGMLLESGGKLSWVS